MLSEDFKKLVQENYTIRKNDGYEDLSILLTQWKNWIQKVDMQEPSSTR